jgi:hypothetical protein
MPHIQPNIVRAIKCRMWVGRVARMGEDRNVFNIFKDTNKRKETSRKARRRWEENTRMNL